MHHSSASSNSRSRHQHKPRASTAHKAARKRPIQRTPARFHTSTSSKAQHHTPLSSSLSQLAKILSNKGSVPPVSRFLPINRHFSQIAPSPLHALSSRSYSSTRGCGSSFLTHSNVTKFPHHRHFSSLSELQPLQPIRSSSLSPLDSPVDNSIIAGDFTLHGLLQPQQRELLQNIKSTLVDIQNGLAPLGLTDNDAKLLRDASNAIDELFLVVAFGEFNSGKSSLLNALLGASYCATGVLPTTDSVTVYRYGDKIKHSTNPNNVITAAVPVEWLRLAHLVDTPGVNAIIEKHEHVSEEYIPSADLVIFVSSLERPFSSSERQFLQKIHAWSKRVVFIINKSDLVVPNLETSNLDAVNAHSASLANQPLSALPYKDLRSSQGSGAVGSISNDVHSHDNVNNPDATSTEVSTATTTTTVVSSPEEDVKNVIHFVQYNAGKVIGHIPPTFAVSARVALAAKEQITEIKHNHRTGKINEITAKAQIMQQQAILSNSGFAALENYILQQLSAVSKIRIKLSNPLAISRRIIKSYSSRLDKQLLLLDTESKSLTGLNIFIDQYLSSVVPQSNEKLAPLADIFNNIHADSVAYIRQRFQVGSLFSLLNGKLAGQYLDSVLGNTDSVLLKHASAAYTVLNRSTNQLSLLLGQTLAPRGVSGGGAAAALAAQQNTSGLSASHAEYSDNSVQFAVPRKIISSPLDPLVIPKTNDNEEVANTTKTLRYTHDDDDDDEQATENRKTTIAAPQQRLPSSGSPSDAATTHKSLISTTTSSDQHVLMSTSQAMFSLGPRLGQILSDAQHPHTTTLQGLIENTLYENIPITIAKAGKKAAQKALTSVCIGTMLMGCASVVPEPVLILSAITFITGGIASFPIYRNLLCRDIQKQLQQLQNDISQQISTDIRHDSQGCVIAIQALMQQLELLIIHERTTIQTTLSTLHKLNADIDIFDSTIQEIGVEEEQQQLSTNSTIDQHEKTSSIEHEVVVPKQSA